MLAIGSSVAVPGHGLCKVTRIEKRTIGGEVKEFYVLSVKTSGASLMLPAQSAADLGVRPVASEEDVLVALRTLGGEPQGHGGTWNRRFREHMDKLRSGSLSEVAEVLRDVHGLRRDGDLSYGERKMLDKARSLLAVEIAEALGISEEAAEGRIDASLR